MQHPCSHYNAFCNVTSPTHLSLRKWQDHMATFMQPFHCDMQTKIQEPHRTTYIRRSSHCRTQRRNQKTSKRSDPHPPHTGGTFHRPPEPLYTEKHKVSCPNYLPKRSPCNIHAAITMRFATSRHKPASIYAHGNTTWQQSCSHSATICNQRFKNRIELRTYDAAVIAEHRG